MSSFAPKTSQSRNLYRASWLTLPVRVAALPLTLMYLLWGCLLRIVIAVPASLLNEEGLDRGVRYHLGEFRRFVTAGASYAAFRSAAMPALTGTVARAGDSVGPWHEARRRMARSHVAMASALTFIAFVYVGLLAQGNVLGSGYRDPVSAPADQSVEYRAPGDLQGAPLGTDFIGRSVLDFTFKGVAAALWIGLFAALMSCAIGMVLGAIAGWFGGWVDDLVVWLYTTMDSIPYLLLLMAFSFGFKNNVDIKEWYQDSFYFQTLNVSMGLFSIILVIGLTSWVGVCRVVRAEYIKQRDSDYVAAAKALGYSTPRIIFRHVMPNVFHLVLISYSLLFVSAIKFEVILSFLGLGMDPGEPSWGNMISQGTMELMRADTVWWQITAAGVALFLLVLCVNLLADALRDALDPRLRH